MLLLLLQSSHSSPNCLELLGWLPGWPSGICWAAQKALAPVLTVMLGWIVPLQVIILRSSFCWPVGWCYLSRKSISGRTSIIDLYLWMATSSFDLWLCQTTLISEWESAARLWSLDSDWVFVLRPSLQSLDRRQELILDLSITGPRPHTCRVSN